MWQKPTNTHRYELTIKPASIMRSLYIYTFICSTKVFVLSFIWGHFSREGKKLFSVIVYLKKKNVFGDESIHHVNVCKCPQKPKRFKDLPKKRKKKKNRSYRTQWLCELRQLERPLQFAKDTACQQALHERGMGRTLLHSTLLTQDK